MILEIFRITLDLLIHLLVLVQIGAFVLAIRDNLIHLIQELHVVVNELERLLREVIYLRTYEILHLLPNLLIVEQFVINLRTCHISILDCRTF